MLTEQDVKSQIEIETKKLYSKNVEKVVKDGKITISEKENLDRLKNGLLISESVASKIYKENANDILQKFIDGAISDEKISPEEEIEMHEIAKSLGIGFEIDEESKEVLEKYKLYWRIENADLPEISPDINIQKSERLHFKTYINWLEQRRITKRVNFAGPTARIKLAKGVYYRMGSIGVQPISEDVWQNIDSGQIYLTNKRLIFMGSKGNKTIKLNKILNIVPHTNGVDVQKESGKSPFLKFSDNIDIFSMILVRLLDEV